MDLQTIGQVSRGYGVSLRMLRYYEKEGLLESKRKDDYAYRVYDEAAILRLRQIIVLRKLRIPVKKIKAIFDNQDATAAVEIFQKNISELDEEITALSTIKGILKQFVEELQAQADITIQLDMLTDSSMLPLIDSLSFTKHHMKESLTMDALSKADKQLSKLQDARIIYLPPMTVASYHYLGENPEENADKAINEFVKKNNLAQIKPDLRRIGFNNPYRPSGSNGYEAWVSIPEDMEVSAPFVKKRFDGGLYASHTIRMGDFHYWLRLQEWVGESDRYQCDVYSARYTPYTEGASVYWDEQLNYFNTIQDPVLDSSTMQLDLLLPIKPIESVDEVFIDIENSVEKCGFKAKLGKKNKFSITGFTMFISDDADHQGTVVQNQHEAWKKVKAEGLLDILLKAKKTGAPILGFGSMDDECRTSGGWRYAVCILDTDIADAVVLEGHDVYRRGIDASKWVCYEMTKERFMGEFLSRDPHGVTHDLGFRFNGPISGHFDVFPEGNNGILDANDKRDRESIVYHWFPIG